MSSGRKSSHWMWFVFPQMKGLGMSHYSQVYGISGIDEAVAYLNHELLGSRLNQVVSILFKSDASNPEVIFSPMDAMKLRSSLALFASVDSSDEQIFKKCLDKFFFGMQDEKTLSMLSH